jgi:CBS domain containing-hemolysin-like protein
MEVTSFAWRMVVTLLFVLINGFFVAAEFAMVKVRPMRIAALAKQGDRRTHRLRFERRHEVERAQ